MTKKKAGAHPVGAPWTADDIAIAVRMWKQMMLDPKARGEPMLGRKDAACGAIAKALNRSVEAIRSRYRDYGIGFASKLGDCAQPARRADPEAERKRLALAAARARQDAIGALLNDPPPGYSALDERRGSGGDAPSHDRRLPHRRDVVA
ncbi:hypothetical protein [Bradyrhizobium sp. SZCCHNR1020]|uniref:hypothetical protein n=1 Tax=Bradyrhizobium sp. SZCCHNR1020 TaxID=3057343 RepID=UPI002915ED80|nr:hypothetical protein [Bradyrhizobium sp. SZCCHNR1020]